MTINLNQIHAAERDLIKKILVLCQKNDIQYFMIGGSLLGAVRHHGFISWDDDVDIGMLRPDYQRFLLLAGDAFPRGNSDHIFLQTPFSDPYYGLSYAKLLDQNYDIQEKLNHNHAQKGLFVDIFPFDAIPESTVERRVQFSRYKLLNDKIIIKADYRPFDINLPVNLPAHRFNLAELEHLKQRREQVMRQYNGHGLSEVKNLSSQYKYDKEVCRAEDLRDLIQVPFEDLEVSIPRNYDQILTRMYGDYIKLPPSYKQEEKHLNLIKKSN